MIGIEGNIVSAELLEKLPDLIGQKPEDFGLSKSERAADEISRCWADAKDLWNTFKRRTSKLGEKESGTSETRNLLMVPLLQNLLGYNLTLRVKGESIGDKNFLISHRDESLGSLPVNIIGCGFSLDRKYDGARHSAHSMMQEYLNSTDHVYGIISNGIKLRLLRDNSKLIKPQFVEWDIEKILEEDKYNDFILLYRLMHSSRMPKENAPTSSGFIEQYYQLSIEEGNRVRDKLRDAVIKSLERLGNGFLLQHQNDELRSAVYYNSLSADDYSRFIRRIVYRILFLMTSEERDLVFEPFDEINDHEKFLKAKRIREIYNDNYSISRFRKLSEKIYLIDPSRKNLWEELLVTFSIFSDEDVSKVFGINPLDGDLFSIDAIGMLSECKLFNSDLIFAVEQLSSFRDEKNNKVRINYRLLDVEELGSVYESLLDLHPVVEQHAGRTTFRFVASKERKTTGSYYTRSDLVNELIKSALEPVINRQLEDAERRAIISLPELSGKDKKKWKSNNNKYGRSSDTLLFEEALLSLKVCDPACGSGHFLLAAARSIAKQLAIVRSGDEQPAPSVYRHCLREVIQHCIYGVDLNPDAVELCKLALWLEGHNSSKPLSFLDHRIRCGNSLVGVTDLAVLESALPDEAFNPVKGDDKELCRQLKRSNIDFALKGQYTIEYSGKVAEPEEDYAKEYLSLEKIDQNDLSSVKKVKDSFKHLRSNSDWVHRNSACNMWTSAFFFTYNSENENLVPRSEMISEFLEDGTKHREVVARACEMQDKLKFFHWPLEFPDVFEKGGFDAMLGNPPWERIKLQEQEFFESKNAAIAEAPNKAARETLIKKLKEIGDPLFVEFENAQHAAEAQSKFLRKCERFPLTARGDINTYSVFAELFKSLINKDGQSGFIVPTGISTDDTNKYFFADLIDGNRIISLFDFENREKLFPSVDSRFKFCLLSISKSSQSDFYNPNFGFFLTRVDHLNDRMRIYSLSKEEFARINPNTRTCPVFRTRIDAELTAKIYTRVPVLVREEPYYNPWGVSFKTMFHMSNDSALFHTKQQLEEKGGVLIANKFNVGDEVFLPLYESKFIWHYDHRFGSYVGVDSRSSTQLPTPSLDQYQNTEYFVMPWYWVNQNIVREALIKRDRDGNIVWEWKKKWAIGFRNVTNGTNERTSIFTIYPLSATGHSMPLVFLNNKKTVHSIYFGAMTTSLTFDYLCRQKIGGVNLTYGYIEQLPYLDVNLLETSPIEQISLNAIELIYTAWDIKPILDDLWNESGNDLKRAIMQQYKESNAITGGQEYNTPEWLEHDESVKLPPFKWHEERRAILKAELDAYYAKLYGLTKDELRYILDPEDVYGEDFPGETFRVLKEKEIRKYGEYRTRRLVLEAWDRQEGETS